MSYFLHLVALALVILIGSIGWRNTFVIYAALTLVTVVPAVWWVIVNRPEQMGLAPDGGEACLAQVPGLFKSVG